MDEHQALQVFNAQIPASGEVDYETVENALRNTTEGRKALRHFHQLRRAGKIQARVNRSTGGLLVRREGVTV